MRADGTHYRTLAKGADADWQAYDGPSGIPYVLSERPSLSAPFENPEEPDGAIAGYIKRVYQVDGVWHLVFDDIEFKKNPWCINNYHTSNSSTSTHAYVVAQSAVVKVTGMSHSFSSHEPSLNEFFAQFGVNTDCFTATVSADTIMCYLPYWITLGPGGKVDSITEQYVP